ncbi:DUF3099 domain-containing protein [Nocardia arizonensis]|uniref:DUF3099 domain-containing protein n=1 Tax=Nocardia arizonensis TaxID=1141647 RepID=UPI0009E9AB2D|nr:DUF3099 domain-containing protein [Nocardia arizonensis]
MQQHGDREDAGGTGGGVRPDATSASTSPSRPRGFFRGTEADRAVLITEAALSLEEQHRSRVRRYTVIMALRIPCLVLAAMAYSIWGSALISLLIIGVSIPLPWIAVLIANDRPPRRKDEPSRWDGRGDRLALESRPHNAIDG